MSTNATASPTHKVPWPPSTDVSATYAMTCHCGAIQWNMTLSPPLLASQAQGGDIYTAVECDCTHCERKGQISCHPLAKDVEFTQGLEHRASYLCATKKNPHWFCRLCGSTLGCDLAWLMENVFHDEEEPRCTINLRMLRDIRPGELSVRKETYMRSQ